jgi:hypothetical protein
MVGFRFKLELADGTPADPPPHRTAVPNWRPGDTIPRGVGSPLRVIAVRDDNADQTPVLVVEDMSGRRCRERYRTARKIAPSAVLQDCADAPGAIRRSDRVARWRPLLRHSARQSLRDVGQWAQYDDDAHSRSGERRNG